MKFSCLVQHQRAIRPFEKILRWFVKQKHKLLGDFNFLSLTNLFVDCDVAWAFCDGENHNPSLSSDFSKTHLKDSRPNWLIVGTVHKFLFLLLLFQKSWVKSDKKHMKKTAEHCQMYRTSSCWKSLQLIHELLSASWLAVL